MKKHTSAPELAPPGFDSLLQRQWRHYLHVHTEARQWLLALWLAVMALGANSALNGLLLALGCALATVLVAAADRVAARALPAARSATNRQRPDGHRVRRLYAGGLPDLATLAVRLVLLAALVGALEILLAPGAPALASTLPFLLLMAFTTPSTPAPASLAHAAYGPASIALCGLLRELLGSGTLGAGACALINQSFCALPVDGIPLWPHTWALFDHPAAALLIMTGLTLCLFREDTRQIDTATPEAIATRRVRPTGPIT